MKLILAVLALAAVAYGASVPQVNPEQLTTFGYLSKYGIPEAERIRKAEEKSLQENPTIAADRITGGSASSLGQFPWQAGLVIDITGLNGNGICGGSLVSNNRVITAAHCWFDGQNQAWRFTVVLGSVFLFSGGERIQTSNVILHPQWMPTLIQNDVGMIYLPQAVAYSANISPVSLPTAAHSDLTFAGETAYASGFGMTGSGSDDGITQDQYLSHVSLEVMTNSVCNIWFFGLIQSSNICTSGTGRVGTCGGDSGGPLVIYDNNRPTVIGITSFGIAFGCDIQWPAAFARVTSFMDFFNSHL